MLSHLPFAVVFLLPLLTDLCLWSVLTRLNVNTITKSAAASDANSKTWTTQCPYEIIILQVHQQFGTNDDVKK